MHLIKIIGSCFLGILFLACSNKDKVNKGAPADIMKSEKLSKEALSKSWDLLKKGQQLAREGKSVVEILKTFPDSTIIQTNSAAILFFIQGSIPMMIELPHENKKGISKKGGARFGKSPSLQPAAVFSSLPATFIVEEEELLDVVASEKGEDSRQIKKALIISPYLSQFGNNDDGLVAKKHLEKNKNYKGRVDFITESLDLNTFKNFDDYDLVHLSTHGERFCGESLIKIDGNIEVPNDEIVIEESEETNEEQDPINVTDNEGNEVGNYDESTFYSYGCRTIIKTGIIYDLEDKSEEEIIEFLEGYEDDRHLIVVTTTSIGLKSSFFDFYYGGLKDKIWVFSACELGQLGDLGETMKNVHEDGHFFYWLNTVYAQDAKPAFEKFYKNLTKEGLDAKKAFEKVPENLRSGLQSEFVDPYINDGEPIETSTSLLHLQTGQPRHGIEVIEMKHPEKENKTIDEGDFYPLVGDFGDGKDEGLTLKVELRGYTKEEFENEQMKIGLKIDDEVVLWNKPFLPDVDDDEITVKPIQDHEYGLTVTITDIAIPDVGEKNELTLKAILHLNDENYSIHKERVTIKADGIRATIRGDGKTIVMTYDDKRRALKIRASQAPDEMYMDEDGFMYSFNPQQGWVKIKLNGMMNMLPVANAFSGSAFNGMAGTNNSNFFFPIVEWGIRFRMSAFERNHNFKKQPTDCGKPQPCHKFVGTAGQELGSYAIFDPGGQLKEINFKGKKIAYEYGKYDVLLPEAKELSIFGM